MKTKNPVRKISKANVISTDILQDTYTVCDIDGKDYYGAKGLEEALDFVEDFTNLYDEDDKISPPPLTIYRGNPMAVLHNLGVTKINHVRL